MLLAPSQLLFCLRLQQHGASYQCKLLATVMGLLGHSWCHRAHAARAILALPRRAHVQAPQEATDSCVHSDQAHAFCSASGRRLARALAQQPRLLLTELLLEAVHEARVRLLLLRSGGRGQLDA